MEGGRVAQSLGILSNDRHLLCPDHEATSPGVYWVFEVGLMPWKNRIVFCFHYNGILSCALWLAKSELESTALKALSTQTLQIL